eukprot:435315_1
MALSTIDSLLKTLTPSTDVKPIHEDEKKEHIKHKDEKKEHKHHSHGKHKDGQHHHGHKKHKKKDEYNPRKFWCGANNEIQPYVFVSPMRYVMGDGVFDHIARYLTLIPSTNPGIIITQQGLNRFGDRLKNIFTTKTNINVNKHVGKSSVSGNAALCDKHIPT